MARQHVVSRRHLASRAPHTPLNLSHMRQPRRNVRHLSADIAVWRIATNNLNTAMHGRSITFWYAGLPSRRAQQHIVTSVVYGHVRALWHKLSGAHLHPHRLGDGRGWKEDAGAARWRRLPFHAKTPHGRTGSRPSRLPLSHLLQDRRASRDQCVGRDRGTCSALGISMLTALAVMPNKRPVWLGSDRQLL